MRTALFPMLRVRRQQPSPNWPPRKEDAVCCERRRDELGRLPIGFCSPECIRRPKNWRRQR